MKQEERLKEMIRLFHEERVIEKLIDAQKEGGIIKVNTVYAKEKKKLFGKLFDFRQKVRVALEKREYYINEDNFEIYPDDALQFCFVCMMAGISDIDVLKDWYQVIDSLKKISGEYKELANKLVKFLGAEHSCHADVFTAYNTGELLEMFFSD